MPCWFKSKPVFFLLAIFFGGSFLFSEAASPLAGKLPRIQPLEPEQALASFRLKNGFEIDQVAAEPMVADPVALAFNARGQLYVVEMHGYPERRHKKIGRVKLLTDVDGDGRFDKSTVFAQGLAWPSAIICYEGGIFLGAAPDILFLRDNNGDGVAEERRVVFSGFSAGKPKEIAPRLFNSLRWGLDNRIHGASSMNGGVVLRPGQPESKAVDLRRHDFSFDPRTLNLRKESGTAQHGMSFDTRGRKYICKNSHHIRAAMYDWRYADRNRGYSMPPLIKDIAVEGPAARIFRISPDEPWRVVRTQLRVDGTVPGLIEGGGTSFGYFTAATGVTIYRGNAFRRNLVDNAFIGAPANNLVHRKIIRNQGVEPVAQRPADEGSSEFLASTDTWFRPVQFANGPDGCLYVADMYREVIEVAHAIPDVIKEHLDIYSGQDRGRIYRIAPDKFQSPRLSPLDQQTLVQLVETLGHPNGWHRDTASRLIFERNNPKAIALLANALAHSKSSSARLRVLHLLKSLGGLKEEHLMSALADASAAVREHAIKLAELYLAGSADAQAADNIRQGLLALINDPDVRVRYQLAFTLGEPGVVADRSKPLIRLARNSGSDPWLHAAILSSLSRGAGDLFVDLAASEGTKNGVDEAFLVELARLIGTQKNPKDMAIILSHLASSSSPRFALASAFHQGLKRASLSLGKVDKEKQLQTLYREADKVARNREAKESLRIQAIGLVSCRSFGEVSDTLFSLLDINQPQSVQVAAIRALGGYSQEEISGEMIARWADSTPAVRNEAMQVLLRRTSFTLSLLKAVEKKIIAADEIPPSRLTYLRGHRNSEVKGLALKVLGRKSNAAREKIITTFLPAIRLEGKIKPGQEIFVTRCATCHRLNGQGFELGPDLETTRRWSKAELLTHVIDPNSKVEPAQKIYQITTRTDEDYAGLIVAESANSITLGQPQGIKTTILRANIRKMKSLGVSMMPEGLEAGLALQDMADLLSYLKNER